MVWNDINFRLLAEAVHPETKALITFFDMTGDCEVDSAGIYLESDGVYYFSGIVSPFEAYEVVMGTEAETGMKLLKEVPCLKK